MPVVMHCLKYLLNFVFVQINDAVIALFLFLARYVPNVAKKSTWHQCILRTDDRPTDLAFWKISNDHYLGNGTSDRPHVWFWCSVFEVGGSNGATSGRNKSKIAAVSRLV